MSKNRRSCKEQWKIAASGSLDQRQWKNKNEMQEPIIDPNRVRSGSIKVYHTIDLSSIEAQSSSFILILVQCTFVFIGKTSSSSTYVISSLFLWFQDTFAELSSNLREEENFNHLKFTDKIKDVKNTKRADMISKLTSRTPREVGTLQ